MVVGEMAECADLLVVGGGPGGYVAAAHAAALGREVVLVDRDGLGGCCLHVGCIPSKALIELADGYEATRSPVPGLSVEAARVDLGAWREWKDDLRARLAAGVEGLMRERGVRVVRGALRFNAHDRAAVETPDGHSQFFEFRQALVATGSRPAVLPGLAPDGERVLDSTGALALDAVPSTVTIVGAGYVGLELGTALAKLGAKVTVVEALDRILPTLDPILARPVQRTLARLGVEVHLNARVRGIDEAGAVVEIADAALTIPAERVIVAVGRRPNTDDLGLELLGVRVGTDGMVEVDPTMRTNVAGIAAIGDVVPGPALAHTASAEGVVAVEALSGLPAVYEPAAVPLVAFTDPEVASAGLTEAQATDAGMDVAVATVALGGSGRAWTLRATEGFVRLVADRATDRVVGAQIAGPRASELIAEAVVAIELLASPRDLAESIHPHPTLSESVHAAAERLLAVSRRPARR